MNAGQRLAAVQLAGHREIDRLYQPLAQQAAEIVVRYAVTGPDGVARLTANALLPIRRDVERMLSIVEPAFVAAIVTAAREAETVADPKGRIDETTLALAGFAALSSLRRNRPSIVEQTGRLVLRGVALNLTAQQTARTVQQYFAPWFAPRRDERGRLLRSGHLGAIASWPGRAGMASQHVRGAMLWDTAAAHGRAMRQRARRDGDLLRYHVSHKHLEIDECDRLEHQDVGLGPGIYLPDDAPSVPRHFRCRCYLEPASRPRFLTVSESVSA